MARCPSEAWEGYYKMCEQSSEWIDIDIEQADYFGETHSDGSAVILVRVGDESRATTVKEFLRGSLGAIEDIMPPDEREDVVREIHSLIAEYTP